MISSRSTNQGVLDPSTGVTQKDVEKDLLCKGNAFIDEPEWPFDNIAVFSVSKSARRTRGGCRGSRRSDRVFDTSAKSNPAKQAFTQIVDTGFFNLWSGTLRLALPLIAWSLPTIRFHCCLQARHCFDLSFK